MQSQPAAWSSPGWCRLKGGRQQPGAKQPARSCRTGRAEAAPSRNDACPRVGKPTWPCSAQAHTLWIFRARWPVHLILWFHRSGSALVAKRRISEQLGGLPAMSRRGGARSAERGDDPGQRARPEASREDAGNIPKLRAGCRHTCPVSGSRADARGWGASGRWPERWPVSSVARSPHTLFVQSSSCDPQRKIAGCLGGGRSTEARTRKGGRALSPAPW